MDFPYPREMTIQCSCCGSTEDLSYGAEEIDAVIEKGWNSFGRALYCPECSRTWYQRNAKDLSGKGNTRSVICRLYLQLHTGK